MAAISSHKKLFTLVALGLGAVVSLGSLSAQKKQAKREVVPITELFRVSKVGRPNVAETRKDLGHIYAVVKADYDAMVKKERAGLPEFEGERVRVLDVLDESDGHGTLHLCIYEGSPAIFSIAGDPLKRGKLTKPLLVKPLGTHETTVVRQVKVPVQGGGQPAFETVGSSDNEATFFGIALPGSSSAPAATTSYKTKEVTETKTYPKYMATVSTVPAENGSAEMTTDLFLSLVKNGEVFTFTEQVARRCQDCGGFGRITDTVRRTGHREKDGKIMCKPCLETGECLWKVTTKVVW